MAEVISLALKPPNTYVVCLVWKSSNVKVREKEGFIKEKGAYSCRVCKKLLLFRPPHKFRPENRPESLISWTYMPAMI